MRADSTGQKVLHGLEYRRSLWGSPIAICPISGISGDSSERGSLNVFADCDWKLSTSPSPSPSLCICIFIFGHSLCKPRKSSPGAQLLLQAPGSCQGELQGQAGRQAGRRSGTISVFLSCFPGSPPTFRTSSVPLFLPIFHSSCFLRKAWRSPETAARCSLQSRALPR